MVKSFLDEIWEEFSGEDGLLVLGKGLGMDMILARLVAQYGSKENLCLVLNMTSEEIHLQQGMHSDHQNSLVSITANISAVKRQQLYLDGGFFAITKRILIVDILNKIVPLAKVTGIVIYNVQKISESSQEHFILRLYRDVNKTGFVKAISDSPEILAHGGFGNLERVLRNLFLKNIFLWPRFRLSVKEKLASHAPDLVELSEPLTDQMYRIQDSILLVIEACLEELKRSKGGELLEIPTSVTSEESVDADVNNSFLSSSNRAKELFRNLEFVVRRQLDSVWNEVGSKTKQLVSDLALLRKLLQYLLVYDCVSFYEFLESIKISIRNYKSLWMLTDAAQDLFTESKNRIYDIDYPTTQATNDKRKKRRKTNEVGKDSSEDMNLVLNKKLEGNPKWQLFLDVLQEISDELKELDKEKSKHERNSILVVCKDEYRCLQLKGILEKGQSTYMQDKWLGFLQRQRLDGKLEVLKDDLGVDSVKNKNFQEYALLKRELSEANRSEIISKKNPASSGTRPLIQTTLFNNSPSSSFDRLAKFHLRSHQSEFPKDNSKFCAKDLLHILKSTSSVHQMNWISSRDEEENLSEVIFCDLESASPYFLLNRIQPRYVVLYDPDIEFIRQLEVFRSNRPGSGLRIYFLTYEDSIEEEKYIGSVSRETRAFEALIRQKSVMMVTSNQDGKSSISDKDKIMIGGPRIDELMSGNVSTRKSGGANLKSQTSKSVVVDMREFRSALPGHLHQFGLEVIPVTLEVGDYILSPKICAERKSLGDLISSLASGRLYNQCQAMSRYYDVPLILIEFDPNSSFSFQPQKSIGDDISPHSTMSRLVITLLHFPKIRLLWSRGPHISAEMFNALKEHEQEPDSEYAASIGANCFDVSRIEKSTFEDADDDVSLNTGKVSFTARDMLRKLPGINPTTFQDVLKSQYHSMQELLNSDKDDLAEIIGRINAIRFVDFANEDASFI